MTLAALVIMLAAVLAAAWRLARRQGEPLLWRVRRKLTVSYLFIGVVPLFLVVVFFFLCGLLLFFNVSSYLVQTRVTALVDETRFLAEATAIELAQAPNATTAVADIVERRQQGAAARYRGASYAVVPAMRTCGPLEAAARPQSIAASLTAGAWAHLDAPTSLPDWVQCDGYAGLLAYEAPPSGETAQRESPLWRTHLVARAVALPTDATPRYAVIVDVPITAAIGLQIENETGIELGEISTLGMTATDVVPVMGRAIEEDSPRRAGSGLLEVLLGQPLPWMTFLDYDDWTTGRSGNVVIDIGLEVATIYERISATPLTQIGNYSFGQLLLILLLVVAILFLVIQAGASWMGLSLARSITGAVDALAVGTSHVRRGDFTHRVVVDSRDQLGDLADSFNSMTASVEDLLHEKAEKERLAQELRIAREIQMSLLPQGPLRIGDVSVTAHCEPAREVGGDYYDYLPLGDGRVGIIIADVAGKGTSAALYMAELKGLMLSLTRLQTSPRQTLIEANRIIAEHLDARSFITMTYAIVDVRAHTLTYARAGHCPLMYLRGERAGQPSTAGGGSEAPGGPPDARSGRHVEIQAPDGLVLGLKIDNGERFDALLREVTLQLGAGDLVLLFTDGVTDAMDATGEPFGEERLAAVIEEHGALPFEELRERILREIHAFVGTTGQHDDLTFVLLTVAASVDRDNRVLRFAGARP